MEIKPRLIGVGTLDPADLPSSGTSIVQYLDGWPLGVQNAILKQIIADNIYNSNLSWSD